MDKSRELYSREGDTCNSSRFEGKTVPWEHTIQNFLCPQTNEHRGVVIQSSASPRYSWISNWLSTLVLISFCFYIIINDYTFVALTTVLWHINLHDIYICSLIMVIQRKGNWRKYHQIQLKRKPSQCLVSVVVITYIMQDQNASHQHPKGKDEVLIIWQPPLERWYV